MNEKDKQRIKERFETSNIVEMIFENIPTRNKIVELNEFSKIQTLER